MTALLDGWPNVPPHYTRHDLAGAKAGLCAMVKTLINRPPYTKRARTARGLIARQLQGKPLSYNNINDTDAAFELVAEFDAPTIAIVKHANPCGVASASDLRAAWDMAVAADPVSAFGGIVAMNRPLDKATASAVADLFTEVVIAPDASKDALKIISAKPNLRLLLTGDMPDRTDAYVKFKSVAGGFWRNREMLA